MIMDNKRKRPNTDLVAHSCTPIDSDFVLSLILRQGKKSKNGLDDSFSLIKEKWGDRFDPDRFRLLKEGEKPVGALQLDPREGGRLRLSRIMFLSPESEKSRERTREAVEALRRAVAPGGAERLVLQVEPDSPMRRTWEAMGFAEIERRSTGLEMEDRSEADNRWMTLALEEGRRAGEREEVPIGAVLVRGDEAVAASGNECVAADDPTAHAEMLVLRRAAERIGARAVEGCDLYVTVEPCLMCAGAILNARLARVIYGAANEKFGAGGSAVSVLDSDRWNHRVARRPGVMEDEAVALMRSFFRKRRG